MLFNLTSAGYERHRGDALNPAGIADERSPETQSHNRPGTKTTAPVTPGPNPSKPSLKPVATL